MSHPIRVLFLLPNLHTGGAEKQIYLLASGLNRSRFHPIVWTFPPRGPMAAMLNESDVEIAEYAPSLTDCAGVEAAVEWVRERRADIYFSFAFGESWEDVLIARLAGIPICVSKRGNMRYWAGAQVLSPFEMIRNSETDAVVANCEAVAAVTAVAENLDRQRIRVIPNGVEIPRRPRRAATVPRIGYVANYRPLKGHELLIDSFSRILTEVPSAELVLAGRDGEVLRAMVDASPAGHRITLTGELLDTGPIYRRLAVYVHPSDTEGLSGSILEAMAWGLPVVATDTGGARESIVDGVTGLLVPPQDPEALTAAILRLLQDPARRTAMGRAGRERVQRLFSVSRMVRDYARLFEGLARDCVSV